MKKIIKLIANTENGIERLDTFISSRINEFSRTRIKNLILDGFVKINGKINCEPSKKIRSNEVLIIQVKHQAEFVGVCFPHTTLSIFVFPLYEKAFNSAKIHNTNSLLC